MTALTVEQRLARLERKQRRNRWLKRALLLLILLALLEALHLNWMFDELNRRVADNTDFINGLQPQVKGLQSQVVSLGQSVAHVVLKINGMVVHGVHDGIVAHNGVPANTPTTTQVTAPTVNPVHAAIAGMIAVIGLIGNAMKFAVAFA